MAQQITPRYFNEEEYYQDVAKKSSLYDEQLMQEISSENRLDYAKVLAGTLYKDSQTFNKGNYDTLINPDDKLAYLFHTYYEDATSDTYKQNEEYFQNKVKSDSNQRYYDSLNWFEKTLTNIGSFGITTINAINSIFQGAKSLFNTAVATIGGYDTEARNRAITTPTLFDMAIEGISGKSLSENVNEYYEKYTAIGDNSFWGGFMKFSTDVIDNVVRMSPMIVSNFIPGAQPIGQAIYYASMAGNTLKETVVEHPDISTTNLLLYTGAVTAVEWATDRLVGNFFEGTAGKGIIKLNGMTSGIKNIGARLLANFGLSFASEAAEEMAAEIIDTGLYNMFIGQKDLDIRDVLYAGLVGGFIGVLGDAVEISTTKKQGTLSKIQTWLAQKDFNFSTEQLEKLRKKTSQVTKLMYEYNLTENGLQEAHPKEYNKAVIADIKFSENLVKYYTTLATVGSQLGDDSLSKALNFIQESSAQQADKIRAYELYNSSSFQGRGAKAVEVYNKYHKDVDGTVIVPIEDPTQVEYTVLKALNTAYPSKEIIAVEVGGEADAKPNWNGMTFEEDFIYIDRNTLNNLTIKDLHKNIVAHELVHNLQRVGTVLSPSMMDYLDQYYYEETGQKINYDSIELKSDIDYKKGSKEAKLLTRAEKQVLYYSEQLMFNDNTIEALFTGRDTWFVNLYKWFDNNAKNTSTNTEKGKIRYNTLERVMDKYRNVVRDNVYNDAEALKWSQELRYTELQTKELLATYSGNVTSKNPLIKNIIDHYKEMNITKPSQYIDLGFSKKFVSLMVNKKLTKSRLLDLIMNNDVSENPSLVQDVINIVYPDQEYTVEDIKRRGEERVEESSISLSQRISGTENLTIGDVVPDEQDIQSTLDTDLIVQYNTWGRLPAKNVVNIFVKEIGNKSENAKIKYAKELYQDLTEFKNDLSQNVLDKLVYGMNATLKHYKVDLKFDRIVKGAIDADTQTFKEKISTEENLRNVFVDTLEGESLTAKNINEVETLIDNKVEAIDESLTEEEKSNYEANKEKIVKELKGENRSNIVRSIRRSLKKLTDLGIDVTDINNRLSSEIVKSTTTDGLKEIQQELLERENSVIQKLDENVSRETISRKIESILSENKRQDYEINKQKELSREAVHYGTLQTEQKSEPLSSWTGSRSTGAFGTGTYFMSKESTDESLKSERNANVVDISSYKLFEVKTKEDGKNLHNYLKKFNDAVLTEGTKDLTFLEDLAKLLKISQTKLNRLFSEANKLYKPYVVNDYFKLSTATDIDTPATFLMKQLGYEGVNTLGITGLDDSEFGTVVYDLDKSNRNVSYEKLVSQEVPSEETVEVKEVVPERKITSQFGSKDFNEAVRQINATVAPYLKNPINRENYVESKNKIDEIFNNKADSISKILNLSILNVKDNIGGYTMDSGDRIKEISYTYQFQNAPIEKVDLFSALLGDLGYENQEAVISANHDENGNGVEHSIYVKSDKNVINILDKIGLTDFTYNIQDKCVRIYELDFMTDSEIDSLNNKINKFISELGDNYYDRQYSKIESRYLDRETRQSMYEKWLSESETSTKKGELYDISSETKELIREAKNSVDSALKNVSRETVSEQPVIEETEQIVPTKESSDIISKLKDSTYRQLTEETPKSKIKESTYKYAKGRKYRSISYKEYVDAKSDVLESIDSEEKMNAVINAVENGDIYGLEATMLTRWLHEESEVLSSMYDIKSKREELGNFIGRFMTESAETIALASEDDIQNDHAVESAVREISNEIGTELKITSDIASEVVPELKNIDSYKKDLEQKIIDVKNKLKKESDPYKRYELQNQKRLYNSLLNAVVDENYGAIMDAKYQEYMSNPENQLKNIEHYKEGMKKFTDWLVNQASIEEENVVFDEKKFKKGILSPDTKDKIYNFFEGLKSWKYLSMLSSPTTGMKNAIVNTAVEIQNLADSALIKGFEKSKILAMPSQVNFYGDFDKTFGDYVTEKYEPQIISLLKDDRYNIKEYNNVKNEYAKAKDPLNKHKLFRGIKAYETFMLNDKPWTVKTSLKYTKQMLAGAVPQFAAETYDFLRAKYDRARTLSKDINIARNNGDLTTLYDTINNTNPELAEQFKKSVIQGDKLDTLKLAEKLELPIVNEVFKKGVERANKLFFKTDNILTDFYDWIGKRSKLTRTFLEGLLPFPRVIFNTTMYALDHSPVGIAKGVYKILQTKNMYIDDMRKSIIEYERRKYIESETIKNPDFKFSEKEFRKKLDSNFVNDLKNNKKVSEMYNTMWKGGLIKYDSIGKNYMFARGEALETLSQGIGGTAVMGLGAILAAIGGFIYDDDDDYMGPCIKIGNLKIGLDSLSPWSTAFSAGAILTSKEPIGNILENLISVYMDSSFLSNVESALKYSDSSKQFIESYMINLTQQYIPSIVKNLAKVTDWGKKNKTGNFLNKLWKTTFSNIPGLSYIVPDKVNPYTGENALRFDTGIIGALYEFISPLDAKLTIKSELEKEAERVGATTTGSGSYYTINDKKYTISSNSKVARDRANYIKVEMTKLINSAKYKRMNIKEQQNAIQNIYSKATTLAKINFWTESGNRYVFTTQNEYDTYKKYLSKASNTVRRYSGYKGSKFVNR